MVLEVSPILDKPMDLKGFMGLNIVFLSTEKYCLVVYIEKDVVCSIDNETIMQRFQNMKTRRRQL